MVSSEVTAKPANVFAGFSGATSILHVVLSPSILYRTDLNCLTSPVLNSASCKLPSIERLAARALRGFATCEAALMVCEGVKVALDPSAKVTTTVPSD